MNHQVNNHPTRPGFVDIPIVGRFHRQVGHPLQSENAELSDPALCHKFFSRAVLWEKSHDHAHKETHACGGAGIDHGLRVWKRQSQRLFADHMLSCQGCLNDHGPVQVCGCADVDDIDILDQLLVAAECNDPVAFGELGALRRLSGRATD
jgi:hypothetical protein